jgi:hypothetical protein
MVVVVVVRIAADSAVPCTPHRDIYAPDPAKMLIGQEFEFEMTDLDF